MGENLKPETQHPDPWHVEQEVLRQSRLDREHLETMLAHSRCLSRQLRSDLDASERARKSISDRVDALEEALGRARALAKAAHLRTFKSHTKNFHHLAMATPSCITCRVLIENERSAS